MAAALQCFASFRSHSNPIRSPGMHRAPEAAGLSRLPASFCAFPSELRRMRTSAVVHDLPSCALPFVAGKHFQIPRLFLDRRFPVHVAFAAPHEDSKQSSIDVESVKDELGIKANESLKAWKQLFESVKEESIKMQSLSQEAYEIYSKRAMIVLKEASQKIKMQADQARHDLSKLAKGINVGGKDYLSTTAKNSPESVKDILETFASSTDELKDVSEVRDFYLGIPYGVLLATGGFLHFMLTESIPAVRFGVILGCALLALSISSLRAWKSGQSSAVFLKGQAVISGIIFIRELNLLFQKLSVPSFLMTLISGAMLVFYVYRLIIEGPSEGPSSE